MIKVQMRNTIALAGLALASAADDTCWVKTEARDYDCEEGYSKYGGLCYSVP